MTVASHIDDGLSCCRQLRRWPGVDGLRGYHNAHVCRPQSRHRRRTVRAAV